MKAVRLLEYGRQFIPAPAIAREVRIAQAAHGGRIQWVSGRPGEAPAYSGTDFIITRDGRIAAVYLFFDKLPCAAL